MGGLEPLYTGDSLVKCYNHLVYNLRVFLKNILLRERECGEVVRRGRERDSRTDSPLCTEPDTGLDPMTKIRT